MESIVSSYSFYSLLKTGQITLTDCIKLAGEMGFKGIEIVAGLQGQPPLTNETAKELRAVADLEGIAIPSLCFSADLLNGSGGDYAAEIERAKQLVDVGEVLGARLIRHDAAWSPGGYKTFQKALPIMAKGCREITEYAEQKGIKTTVENHGFFMQDSDRMEQLVAAVDHPNFGLLIDIGNFLCVDESPATAVGRLAPYAFLVHAKDFYFKSGSDADPGEGFGLVTRGGNRLKGAVLGHGVVPVSQCLTVLKKAGYDGYVTVEYEGAEPALTAIPICKSNLERYLKG